MMIYNLKYYYNKTFGGKDNTFHTNGIIYFKKNRKTILAKILIIVTTYLHRIIKIKFLDFFTFSGNVRPEREVLAGRIDVLV